MLGALKTLQGFQPGKGGVPGSPKGEWLGGQDSRVAREGSGVLRTIEAGRLD